MEPGKVTKTLKGINVATLADLIKKLTLVFEEDKINIDSVIRLMSSYKSNEKEWDKFAKFDPNRYTRNLVDDGNGKFNVMIIAWDVDQRTGIHDHPDAHCFVKVLSGSLKETRYSWPEGSKEKEMISTQEFIYKKNDVSYINDSMGLHLMSNGSSTEKAVSLHCYCPPFIQCSTFDQATGRGTKCLVSFWSIHGEKVATLSSECLLSPWDSCYLAIVLAHCAKKSYSEVKQCNPTLCKESKLAKFLLTSSEKL